MYSLRSAVGALKRRAISRDREHRSGPMYRLAPESATRGRALLSIGTQLYERVLRGEPLDTTHTAVRQNLNIVRTLLDLGLEVDVIGWDDFRTRPPGTYDVIHDVISNLSRLAEFGSNSCVKILHPIFAHWLVHNSATYDRHFDLFARRGFALAPARLLPASGAIDSADHIYCVGGPFSTGSYRSSPGQLHVGAQMHPFALHEFLDRDMNACRSRFIWLGGAGCVHKGLDLTLEAFAELPDCELFVCGPVAKEQGFTSFYQRELFELPNVHLVGWTDTMSESWRLLSSSCAGSILPSVSEMSVTSLICSMMTGLIPIATDGADIDLTDVGIRIEHDTVEGIKHAVCALRDRDTAELEMLSRQAYEAAGSRYGYRQSVDTYRSTLCEILAADAPAEWSREDRDPILPEVKRLIPKR